MIDEVYEMNLCVTFLPCADIPLHFGLEPLGSLLKKLDTQVAARGT